MALAVESPNDALADPRCFYRIIGFSHACSKARQFFARKFSFRVELISKANNAQLFFRIEAPDFFNDLVSGHGPDINARRSGNQFLS